MKNFSKRIGICEIVVFVFLLGSSALRTVALFTEYDVSVGYFDNKTLIAVANALLIAGAVCALSSVVAVGRELKLVASFDGASTYIPSGIVSVALLFAGAGMLLEVKRLPGALLSKESLTDLSVLMMLALAALSIVAMGAFLYNALSDKRADHTRSIFSVFAIIFLMLYSVFLYFDTSLPINAHVKIVDQMAYMFTAVFFLYEARISLGRAMWRAYLVFGMIAALLTAYSSVPALIIYFVRGTVISHSIYETVLSFALFIYISARLILTTELHSDVSCETVDLVQLMCQTRADDIKAAEDSRACTTKINVVTSTDITDAEPANYTMDIDGAAASESEETE